MCEFKIAYQKLTKLVLYQIIRTELKAYNNTRRYSHNFGLTQNLPIYIYTKCTLIIKSMKIFNAPLGQTIYTDLSCHTPIKKCLCVYILYYIVICNINEATRYVLVFIEGSSISNTIWWSL